MKKKLFFVLFIFLIVLFTISCNNTEPSINPPSDTTDGDNSSVPVFNDPITDYDTVDETSTEKFVIKSKKYDYEDNNVVIMNVENQSENNYTVTVDMTYYDDAGKEITKDSQSFEGFSANWQKYFMFKPDMAFSSYEYKLTTEAFDGECYDKTFTFDDNVVVKEGHAHLGEDENGIDKGMGRGILGYIKYKYEYSQLLEYWLTAVFFDKNGEIYYISTMSKVANETPYMENEFSRELVLGTANSVEWPEELKGETSGILILNNIGIGITPLPQT